METIQFEREGAIAFLTFNRPAHHNAMTWEMYDRLVELCDLVDRDSEILVWVLRGAGDRAFVSGTDIHQFVDFHTNEGAGVEYEERIDRVLARLAAVKKPVIALIDGYAIGGGLLLAVACDIRIATPESTFGVPCVKLGNCLSMANYGRLLDLVGPAKTLELVYTGRQIDANEAMMLGLVNQVVPRGEIESYVLEFAGKITRSAPITIRVTKEAVQRLSTDRFSDGTDLIRACYNSRDFQEGVAAFIEKRTPVWQGQ